MESTREHKGIRSSGFRMALIGLVSLVLAFLIYSRLTSPAGQATMIMPELKNLAYTILAITFMSLGSIGYGVYRILIEKRRGAINGSSQYFIALILLDNKYRRIMAISSVMYGVVFGFLSQIFIYNDSISFLEQGITVPYVNVVPCCNIPGYVPMLSVYLTDHFLVLIIPINIILAITVSVLVGFNIALSFHTFKFARVSKNKTPLIQSIGLTGGLFVGCPTCAGSIFSALLGISAGTSIAVLALFQTFFIGVTIPALLISPLLMIRTIRRKSFRC
jgi:hypothetical protein